MYCSNLFSCPVYRTWENCRWIHLSLYFMFISYFIETNQLKIYYSFLGIEIFTIKIKLSRTAGIKSAPQALWIRLTPSREGTKWERVRTLLSRHPGGHEGVPRYQTKNILPQASISLNARFQREFRVLKRRLSWPQPPFISSLWNSQPRLHFLSWDYQV